MTRMSMVASPIVLALIVLYAISCDPASVLPTVDPFGPAARTIPRLVDDPPKAEEGSEEASVCSTGYWHELQQNLAPRAKYDCIIQAASTEFDVDFYLIKAIIQIESGFDPGAVSPVGACGLMQLMPETARMLGVEDAFDPEENIFAGVRYLNFLLDTLDGDLSLALAAYNAGITKVRRYKGIPPYRVTRRYVKQVFRHAERLRAAADMQHVRL